MSENFEQDIPIMALFAGFVVLMVSTTFLRYWLRKRNLIREGQLQTKNGRIPTVEERVAGNPSWAKGEILSKGRTLMILIWVVAISLNLMLGVPFIKSFSNPAFKTGPIVILGILSLLGIVALFFAARFTIQFFRFGESLCCIQGKAGVLGQIMKGVIRTKGEIKATGDYVIDLQCLEFYTTGSGKNRRSQTKTHWQSRQQIPHVGKNSKIGIPFSFDLPNYPPETGHQITRGSINWQLNIKAPVEGVDYSAVFHVPVFKMDYSK